MKFDQWGRCIAVVDGRRCQNRWELVKLCRPHYGRQRVLIREGRSLTFITGFNFARPAPQIGGHSS